jgi:hypothetical protein
MKFSDIERGNLKVNIDGPVDELMSLGSEVRKATGELASKLDDLSKQAEPDVSYGNIDQIMRSICKQHGCKGPDLHDDFIAAKGMTPDEYVRDRIRSNGKNVLEAPHRELNEGPYDDRVQQVANAIIARSQSVPFKKEEIPHWIEVEADYKRVPELGFKDRRSSRAWPDFVKDVLVALRGQVKYERAPSTRDRGPNKVEKLNRISQWIEDAVGQSFPDGDPYDLILPKLRRLGIDPNDASKWIDAATKSHLGARSFNEYMGKFYDDMAADNPEMMLQSGMLYNPYTNRPFNFVGQLDSILKQGNEGLALNIIANAGGSLSAAKDTVAGNKEVIVRALLKLIKRDGNPNLINGVIRNIKGIGYDWPEFTAIQRSMAANELRESMKPGDVLMIENSSEAVVGTVLSIDCGTIILEGGVYPLDEEELDEIRPSGKKEAMMETERFPDRRDDLEHAPSISSLREVLRSDDIITDPLGSEAMDRKEIFKLMIDKIKKLSPRYQTAIEMWMHGDTFKQIGDELGVGPERARQLVYKVIRILYHDMSKRHEFDYMKARDVEYEEFVAGVQKSWHKFTPPEKAAIKAAVSNQPYREVDFAKAWKKIFRLVPVPTPSRFRDLVKWAAYSLVDSWGNKPYDPNFNYKEMNDKARKSVTQPILDLNEAEYQGREVKLGKPMSGDVKKYKVYVKDPKTGNIKKVNFGDKGMEIKRDDPERRKSFRARHGCGTPRASDRTKAAYWSCRLWSTKKVSDILKGK